MANRYQDEREGEERRWRRTWPDERETPNRNAPWRYEPYAQMRDLEALEPGGRWYEPQPREPEPVQGRPDWTGRGPKGYSRSDERICDEVCDRLTFSRDVDASGIEVRVKNGEVHLVGTVPDRYMKWLAEEIADRTPGVTEVDSRLRVPRTKTH